LKYIKIKIEFGCCGKTEKVIKLRLEKGIFSKGVDLIINGKFEGRMPVSKITNRILKRVSEYLKEKEK